MDEFESVRKDAEALAATAREAGAEAMGHTERLLRDALDGLKRLQTQVAELAGQASQASGAAGGVIADRGREAIGEVSERVRAAPVTSLMIAAGLGYLIGMLGRRDG